MGRSSAAELRSLVEHETVIVPGVFNALAARLVQRHGFAAVYLSGAGCSASLLAMPDIGLLTLTELVQQTSYVHQAIDIPIIVDADTGFGGPIHVERAVRELEAAGAAAIQIEDQVFPKKCGHLSGKQLIGIDEMCAKIRAAAAARRSPDTIIIARTDARGVTGWDDAIARAEQYIAAGADWIFPEALLSAEEFHDFAQRIPVPLVANMTEFGRSPLLPVHQLAQMGYAVVLFPVTLLRVAMKAVESALRVMAAEQSQVSLLPMMQTRAELYDLLDYDDYDERDRRFFAGGARS